MPLISRLTQGQVIVEEQGGDATSVEDTGIKFLAWGTSVDRLYTGSSDGVVKVWNIRSSQGNPLIRDILECPAPVSYGAFSPDFSKLVVGDASGRVFVLTLDVDDVSSSATKGLYTTLRLPDGTVKTIRRPRPLTPHQPPPPPAHDADGKPYPREEDGVEIARRYLAAHQLEDTGVRTIGVVQGPNYAALGFYRREFHYNNDPAKELLAGHSRGQLANRFMYTKPPRSLTALRDVSRDAADNMEVDDGALDVDGLDERLRHIISHERANEDGYIGLAYVDSDDEEMFLCE